MPDGRWACCGERYRKVEVQAKAVNTLFCSKDPTRFALDCGDLWCCRPLGLFLEDNQLLKDRPHRKGRRRPGAMKGSKDGWTSGRGAGAAARAAASSASRPALDGYRSDAEQMEAEALARVGQRRWAGSPAPVSGGLQSAGGAGSCNDLEVSRCTGVWLVWTTG